MRKAIAYLLAVAAVVAAIVVVRQAHRPVPPAEAAPAAAAAQLKPTTTMPVKRGFARRLAWTGEAESRARVEVEALTDGRIASVEVPDETPVEAGARLFTIGGPRAEAKRQRLRDAADALQRRVALAQQVLERKRQNVARHLATLDDVAAAEDALASLKAQQASAQLGLRVFEDSTVVVAPAAGVFTGRRVSVGQAVRAGQVLCEVVDPARLRVRARVFAPSGVGLAGMQATVRLSQTESLSGKVARVLPGADATGAAQVWIEGDRIDGALRPGQVVGGVLEGPPHEGWAVPESAVVYDEQEAPCVFVARGGRFERVAVKVGIVSEGWAEVVSGLDGTLPVVRGGAYELLQREFQKSYQVAD